MKIFKKLQAIEKSTNTFIGYKSYDNDKVYMISLYIPYLFLIKWYRLGNHLNFYSYKNLRNEIHVP